MNRWTGFLAAWTILLVVGCQRAEPLKYTLSEDTLKQPEALQTAIQQQLTKYCGTPESPKLLGKEFSDDKLGKQAARDFQEHLRHGEAVYRRRCQQCHGVSGDGAGPESQFFKPLPRDYRKGLFKFTSTANRAKPRRSDLLRTLRRGVTGTAMPSFDRLSQDDLEAVVDYVLALTHRGELEIILLDEALNAGEIDPEVVPEIIAEVLGPWQQSETQVVLPQTPMPEFTPESIEEGRQEFVRAECYKCHGIDGRGGTQGVDVGDDSWGHKAAAADLTSGIYRGGGRPIDIYRRIYAGITGSPMGAFGQNYEEDPDTVWRLVHFIKNVGERRRRGQAPEPFASPEEVAAIAAEKAGATDESSTDGGATDEGAPDKGDSDAEDSTPESDGSATETKAVTETKAISETEAGTEATSPSAESTPQP